MHKYFSFAILLITYPLLGNDLPSCYSVQLKSAPQLKQTTLQVPQGCQEMQISSYATWRCGCFETATQAIKSLSNYKHTYPDAIIVANKNNTNTK